MGEAASIALIVLLSTLLGAGVAAAILWRLMRRAAVEPHVVYEKPRKKKILMVAGHGAMELRDKRPARVNDDVKAWRAEMKDQTGAREP